MTLRQAGRRSYRPGEETRGRLLEAGLVLFGRQGFDGTSVRQLAVRAGVAVPAIAYHYTDKAGLYHACALHVIRRYRERMAPLLGELGDPAEIRDREAARDALHRIVLALSDMLVPRGSEPGWTQFMMREMQIGGPAYDLMLERLWLPGLALTAALVGRARGRATPTLGDRIAALHLLSGLNWQGAARKVSEAFLGHRLDRIPRAVVAAEFAALTANIGSE